ncbi:helicase C-terminal domain-containing protein [Halocatena pleomorpha]|uniref:ATP-dependent DNA helicase n=1 Tax=Halocatena pleomorpha TaxID=1785090 RepID=A0A3P3R3X9_9EURY|nr:ATP-dependent DNA helicase [Halocatena pleomorpha]RRJ28034.1 ATP-dependent DNA helicase [Halocatena pleomorpha]
MNPTRIESEFPADAYRGAQRQALTDIRTAFAAGNDIVLVRAPTGSGKSLLARAIAGCARRAGEADAGQPIGAYYTTPQVSQLDDVAADPLLDDLNVIQGKGNYSCVLPGETTTPVDRAPCARETGFDCPVKHRCPYFSDRDLAANRPIAAMTLAYFMQTAGSTVFDQRDVLVIDEAHGLVDWAEMYATIELGPETVPVWDRTPAPEVTGVDGAIEYAETLVSVCDRKRQELQREPELSAADVATRDRLAELIRELQWFVTDVRDPESATTWVTDQHGGEGTPLTIKPMNPERYLVHTVWDRATSFALLSATILNKTAFCRQTGLDPSRVALVDVEHTFPVENRPLFDVTQGKMTHEHRDETLPKLARLLVRLMQHHEQKGIVHCHSYAIAERLATLLSDFGVGERVRSHDRENRNAVLSSWKRDDSTVLLSVKMEEALDLEGDLARWQVLCKAPFPNTRDSRVARRLEDGQWGWYYRSALRTVIQACGRVVRSPTDEGATYLADESLLDLFDRARSDVPPWFQAQIDRMRAPSLPAFDPSEACLETATDRRRSTAASTTPSIENHPLDDVWQ